MLTIIAGAAVLIGVAVLFLDLKSRRTGAKRWSRMGAGRRPWAPTPQSAQPPAVDLSDHGAQLKVVASARFEARRPVNREASQFLYLIERALAEAEGGHRVFAEVSLGAFLATSDRLAWMVVNSKRVDFLVIDAGGFPVLAVEYHGSGHEIDGAGAAARDAIKRTALRSAGVELLEVRPGESNAQHAQVSEAIQRAVQRSQKRSPARH